MESGKQGVSCSETSSEENDRPEQAIRDENSGARRSYECTYCKRGFTNAQALGGHMNIHRKDRAKARQHSSVSSLSNYHRNEEIPMMATAAHPFSANCSPFSSQLPAWDQTSSHHHVEPSHHHHHNMSFQPMNHESEHYNPFGFSRTSNSSAMGMTRDSNMNDELLGANLSLQIDPSDLEDHETTRASAIDDEVDLELRLGHG